MHAAYPRFQRPPFFRPVVPCLKTGLLLSLLAVWIIGLAGSPGSIAPPVVDAAPALPPAYQASALPLAFVPNQGQTDAQVAFEADVSNGHIFFTPDEVVLSLERAGAANDVLRVQFLGANQATVEGLTRISGQTSYMIGNDPDAWQTGLPHYGDLIYRGIYPGIDLHYTGSQGQLKSTFLLAAGADPALIGWSYAGATRTRIDPVSGNLLISMPGGEMVETAPIAWQTIGGEQLPVNVAFAPRPDGSIGFQIGAYNPAFPLTIDPTLEFSSYLGGTNGDIIYDVTVDDNGDIYVVGVTNSGAGEFPGGAGTVVPGPATPAGTNIFVSKVNGTSLSVEYVAIIGGGAADVGLAIDVDASGVAYIGGRTASGDLPMVNPIVGTLQSVPDGLIMALNAAGNALTFSTYFGGNNTDEINDIVAVTGGVGIVGTSQSTFALTGLNDAPVGGTDVLFARINLAGTPSIAYGALYGGSLEEQGLGIDAIGDTFYFTGQTNSGLGAGTRYPTTNFEGGAATFDDTPDSAVEAFISVITVTSAGVVTPVSSSFLGGNGGDSGTGIAVIDDAGTIRAFVSGVSTSDDLPGDDGSNNDNALFAAIDLTNLNVDFITLLSSAGEDRGRAIAVDNAGNAYLAGDTNSDEFPVENPLPGFEFQTGGGNTDAFVTRFGATGGTPAYEITYSSRFGGSASDVASGVALTTSGDSTRVILAGETGSSDLPTTAGAFQPVFDGPTDGFLTIIGNLNPVIDLNGADTGIDISLTYEEQQADVAVEVAPTLTISDSDNLLLTQATVQFVESASDAAATTVPPDAPAERLDWNAAVVPGGMTVSYSETTGLLTLEGPATPAQFEQVLQSLTYENTSGDAPSAGERFLRFTADDGLNTNSPFAYATIDFQPINDAPSLQIAPTSGEAFFGPFDEDSADNPLANIGITDPDAPPTRGTMNVTLSVPNGSGNLAVVAGDGDSSGVPAGLAGNNSSILSITGAITDVVATLDNIVEFTPAANVNGDITLTVVADDRGVAVGIESGSALLGEPQIITETVVIRVTAINDAPALTVTSPLSTAEDTDLTLSGIDVADVDVLEGTGNIQVDLSVTSGTLIYTGTVATVTGSDTANMTVSGVITDVNTVLDTITYRPAEDFVGSATLTVDANDLGNFPTPALDAIQQTVTIDVVNVNDPPEITVPTDPLNATEDTTLTGAASAIDDISISDVDVAGGNIDATLAVDRGTLTATGAGVTGSGTANLSMTGTITDVNTWLATLEYVPATDDNSTIAGNVTLTVNADDNGNTGTGGVQSATEQTVEIAVTPVNDEPGFTSGGNVTVDENSGAYSQPWATNLQRGPATATDEVSQTLTFSVTVDSGAGLLDGTVVISPNGTLNFTPAENANGTVDVTVQLQDSGSNLAPNDNITDPVSFQIIITAVNNAPEITVPTGPLTVLEDTTLTGAASAIDDISISDVDAAGGNIDATLAVDRGTLTATGAGVTGSGTASLSMTGTITDVNTWLATLEYVPATDDNSTIAGNVTLTVNADDNGNTGTGGVQSATEQTVEIAITPVNDAPSFTKGADPVTVAEDSGAYSQPWATNLQRGPVTATDEVTQTLSFNVNVSSGGDLLDGTVTISPDGRLNFTPALNASGTVSVTVTMQDSGGTANGGANTSPQTGFEIQINPVNDAPDLTVTSPLTATEDTTLTNIGVNNIALADADVGAGTMALTLTVTNGTLAATGASGTGTAGDPLLIGGTLAAVNTALDSLAYTPDAGYVGPDTLTIDVSDNGNTPAPAETDQATIIINVTGVNDPPSITVGTPSFTTNEDTVVNVTGITVDDPDAASGQLRLTLTVPTNAGTISAGGVTSSTVVLTGTLAQLNTALGNLSFDPATDYNSTIAGGDVTLDIDLNDLGNTGSGGPLDAQDSVAIDITPINDAPVIAGDTTVTINEDAGAQTINGFVIAGPGTATDEIAGQSFAAPGGISINNNSNPGLFAVEPAIAANGTLTFTPADNAYGTAVVNITITDNGDGTGLNVNSTTTDFTVVINPVNDQPTFTGSGNPPAVDEDSGPQVVAGWATNIDSGVDPDEALTTEAGQTLTFVLTPTNTTLFAAGPAIDPTTGDLTYTPADDAFGSTIVTVVLQDSGGTENGGVDTSTPVNITITINPVNDDPSIVGNNPVTLDEDSGPQSIADWAIPGPANESAQTLTYGLIVNDNTALFTAAGRPTVTSDGTLTFTTGPDAFGTANIDFTLTDSEGAAITETLVINVTEIEDPPVAGDDPDSFGDPAFTTDEDTPLVLTTTLVLANDTDADGDPITVTEVSPTSANGGSVTLSGTTITYTPAQDYNGTDTFTYTISDGRGGFDSATVLVTINPVNDAPVAVADTVNVLFDALNVPIDVLANDIDVDNDPLRVSAATQPANGQVTISPDGSRVFYTPTRGYEGPDSFEYTMQDPDGLSSSTTVQVSVGKAVTYLPFIQTLPVPDLVGSVTVEPVSPIRRGPAQFTVTVTNNGTAPASNFWVDLYINPRRTPVVNERWNDLCVDSGDPDTCIGLAWFVETPVPPGGSIQLTSAFGEPNGYDEAFSRWPGFFNRAGVQQIFVYVDSWNRDLAGDFVDPNAAVDELNENNNLTQLDVLVQERPETSSQEPEANPDVESEPVRDIPPRPAVNKDRD